jgi:hypothetical protein
VMNETAIQVDCTSATAAMCVGMIQRGRGASRGAADVRGAWVVASGGTATKTSAAGLIET